MKHHASPCPKSSDVFSQCQLCGLSGSNILQAALQGKLGAVRHFLRIHPGCVVSADKKGHDPRVSIGGSNSDGKILEACRRLLEHATVRLRLLRSSISIGDCLFLSILVWNILSSCLTLHGSQVSIYLLPNGSVNHLGAGDLLVSLQSSLGSFFF